MRDYIIFRKSMHSCKTLRIIKIVMCLGLLLPVIGLNAQRSVLDRKISIDIQDKSIKQALGEIEIQEGVFFSYNPSAVKTAKKKTKKFVDKPLRKVLDTLFEDYKVFYQAKDDIIYIRNEARKGKLIGKVTDNKGMPMAFVSVFLKGTTNGASTTDDGRYEFSAPEGTYVLDVSYIGYTTIEKRIIVKPDETVIHDFTLQESTEGLDVVVIEGKTVSREKKEEGFQVNAIEVQKLKNSSLNVNQILSRSTGVKIREQGGQGSNFEFAINGLSGNQVRFFIDGVPMENFGSSMNLNNIPVNYIERIEVFKGVVPVELGADALGGAVNIITKKNAKRSIDVSYSYGSFNTHNAVASARYTTKNNLFVNLDGYYNYSDNNYLMRNNPEYGVKVWVIEDGREVRRDQERFHDNYWSYLGQVEAGVTNKKYADLLSVGLTYTDLFKEQQTGATPEYVYGNLRNDEHAIIPTLKYAKDSLINDRLSANFTASLAFNQLNYIDTTKNRYDWGGNIWRRNIVETETDNTEPTLGRFNTITMITKTNLGYTLNDNHALGINHNYSWSENERYNRIFQTEDEEPGLLAKHILGLSWNSKTLDGKLSTNVFGKYYGLHLADLGKTKDESFFGYGIASRYRISKKWGIKSSFERSYRLQEKHEVFGNGFLTFPNENLRPENSYNFNLGSFYSTRVYEHSLSIELSGFHREANDFINNISFGKFNVYRNLAGVRISGIEGDIKYSLGEVWYVNVNASYQNAISKNKYIEGTDRLDVTYKNRLPNRPWLYGNFEWGIGKDDWFQKDSRVQFVWNTAYTHWFYLSWAGLGSKESKNKIPSQLIHNAGISYSLGQGKYNISFQLNNLTNALAYDNFRLQKPGRNFFIKLRYAIR